MIVHFLIKTRKASRFPRSKHVGDPVLAALEKLHGKLEFYSRRHCNKDILIRSFSRLPNLQAVSVTSTEYPFKGKAFDILRDDWEWKLKSGLPNIHDYDLSTNDYSTILEAIGATKPPITTLVLDHMPLKHFIRMAHGTEESAFNPDQAASADAVGAMAHVQKLRICVSLNDYMQYGWTNLGLSMGSFLNSMQNLRSLDLTLQKYLSASAKVQWSWQETFHKCKWPQLESLRLSNPYAAQDHVLSLIYRHKSTLKRLSLRSMVHWNTPLSQKQVLEDFRDYLKLEKFEFLVEYSSRAPPNEKLY